jgi:hypothetical protein
MRKALSFSALALSAVLVLGACGSDDNGAASSNTDDMKSETSTSHTTMHGGSSAELTASDLRSTLELQLQEHVYLAGLATGQALSGNTKGFEAAAATLDQNSDDLAASVGAVYGDEAGQAFDPLWKKHIGFFVDYTNAIAKDDKAGADKANADLTAYAGEFGAFIESATKGGLPKDAVAELVGSHAQTLIAAIDAQKAGNAKQAYALLKEAAGHMTMIAAPLAGAIDKQLDFEGATDSDAANLRATLNRNLQEHVYLAGAATGEALAGNTKGFEAAAAALDTSSNDLIAAVTSVYGAEAGQAFDPLWKKHIGFFVDYTNGIATDDKTKSDKALADLQAYAGEFGAFIESATVGGLPKDAVAKLLESHATTLIAAIDAQKAGEATAAFANLKEAAGHMPAIADPLAAAIAKQKNLS